jgi:LmbE family N-acetylglucosaminyl deacetylase
VMHKQELFVRATLAIGSGIEAPAAMLVFAHPDDEVIALGARLARYRSALIVHVTDGAPRNEADSRVHGFSSPDAYRACRQKELDRAMEGAGLEKAERILLPFADQEASLHLTQLTCILYKLLTIYDPAVVFTHPYEGGHPDHDACAYAVQRAVTQLQVVGRHTPMIIEAPFYHLGVHGMETGYFLPHSEKIEEICCFLSVEEQRHKQALFACFPSQQEMLRCFSLEWERFRIAPHYDFQKPPHNAPVFYDQFSWGMTSQRFCELVCAADAILVEVMEICH